MTKTNSQINAEVLNNQVRKEYREEVRENKHSYNLQIKISSTDYDLLLRIANEQSRRLSDLLQLVFAAGLECHFGEEGIRFQKRDCEWTDTEIEHMQKQKDLAESEGWEALSYEEKKARGFVHGSPMWRNFRYHCGHEIDPSTEDNLIEPMAHRIASFAYRESDNTAIPA